MLRGFTDSTGVEWRVWEVLPSRAGDGREFLSMSSLQTTPFADGWLCFESTEQKRRLAPIPSGWESRDTLVLEQLCSQATVVPVRRREHV
jgi:hypothetical protein